MSDKDKRRFERFEPHMAIWLKPAESDEDYHPLILENITYTINLPGEMTESQFLAEVLEQNNCGMLLDLTNVYTNSINHRCDAIEFLEQLPLERVVELHFAGGHWQDGVLIDSHSQPAPPEVWTLMEEVIAKAPVRGIVLERDENLPAFSELASEVERARSLLSRHTQ